MNACSGLEPVLSNAAWKSTSPDQTMGASLSSNARRNHVRSTSAMWRTKASSDRVDGGIDAARSSSAASPSHFIASVARW